ncbi:hypothetical protein [uncultured Cohaesibacter sp.]|uniref:hypothetical protein n=1 Tax=uncultured Cohaesibacter sp. TaxID=1002546 RepID=UPI0029C60AF6|nr:hypothetical protein [uncultured Cohaesibacter sp.]
MQTFGYKAAINATVGAAGASLLISSEIGAMLFGFTFEYLTGPVQIVCNIVFSLIILFFFSWYCTHAYQVEKNLKMDNLPREQDERPEPATK